MSEIQLMKICAPLVVGAPLAAAAVTVALGGTDRTRLFWPAIAALSVAWLASLLLAVATMAAGALQIHGATWLWAGAESAHLTIPIGFKVDALAATFLVVATSAALSACSFAATSRRRELGGSAYGAAFPAIAGAANAAILADNLGFFLLALQLLAVLVYWVQMHVEESRPLAAPALLLSGCGLVTAAVATLLAAQANLNFDTLADPHGLPPGVANRVALLLLGAAACYSAQLPFHNWLTRSARGPAATSIVLQCGTVVPVAVYLLVRCQPLLLAVDEAFAAAQFVGLAGALLFALAALTAADLRCVLAYSTASQAGLLAVAVTVSAPWLTALMAATHGLAKSVLIMAGAVVIAASRSGDLAAMGGLRSHFRLVYWTFAVAAAALVGLPPFAGYWMQVALLNDAGDRGGMWLMMGLCAVAALTAMYTTRLLLRVFHGHRRFAVIATTARTHPARVAVMTALAAACVGAAAALPATMGRLPGAAALSQPAGVFTDVFFLRLGNSPVPISAVLAMVTATAAAAATALCLRAPTVAATAVRRRLQAIFELQLYERLLVRPLLASVRWIWTTVDSLLLEAVATRGPALLIRTAGWIAARAQTGQAAAYLTAALTVTALALATVALRGVL